jgi:CRISPR-associated protein (TIGR03986 family)
MNTPIKINIDVSFLEPYRLIEWFEKEKRETEKKYLRGQTFAKWHGDNKKGRPYITGTLLRSTVLRSAEKLISLNSEWKSRCCDGYFETDNKNIQPKFRRKRPSIKRKDKRECTTNKLCPLCILTGVFDKAGKGEDAKKDIKNHHVHFSNLNLSVKGNFDISEVATSRTLNRVDRDTGKAQDYFKIWEVEDKKFWHYTGTITINNDGARELLEDSLKFVDKLCGALCRIEIINKDESKSPDEHNRIYQPNENQETRIIEVADKIISAFENQGKLEKVRTLADTIRMMSLKELEVKKLKDDNQFDIIDNLPKGKEDNKGHFIWDIKVAGLPLRTFLKECRLEQEDNQVSFFKSLGQKLYEKLKAKQGKVTESFRALGESEYYSEQNPVDFNLTTVPEEEIKEFIVTGKLRSETPFYVGVDSKDGEQTSSQILLTRDGKYRIPRSTLRGALRMDLRTAFDTGCEVKLGGDAPCDCPVCLVMRNVTIMDKRSEYSHPPEIRNRIRMNPYTSTTDEGALFDMEVGPEGLEFGFVLRYRGSDIPRQLYSVLRYWREGKAFFGGSTSTGKGRFSLNNLKIFKWNLSGQALSAYLEDYGYRGAEDEMLGNANGGSSDYFRTYFPDNEEEQKLLQPYKDYLKPRWKKVTYQLEFKAPLLTADPIAALLDVENHDTVAFEKIVLKENEDIEMIPAIKGETIRGIIRKAVGKRNGDLEKEHEDCQCSLCRIFGSEHEISKIRFEDLTPINGTTKKKIDHVAIDRFHGGAEDAMKFDTFPIAASPREPLILEGNIWLSTDIKDEDIDKIKMALSEVSYGLHPIGGKSGTGYGWVTNLLIKADQDFELPKPLKAESAEESGIDYPKIDLKIDPEAVYYPHYFLKPGSKVERQENPDSNTSEVIGHERWDPDLLSGKISCSLKTLTPLIIPDTVEKSEDENGYEEDDIGHKSYKFFRINGEELIPGSEIRGMISNVYEALTNSCFRILDESKYLSWRMKPEEFVGEKGKNNSYKAGRVIKEDGQLKIVEAEESIRLPLYDDENLINDILKPTNEILNQRNGENRWKNALKANRVIADTAAKNRKFLNDHPNKPELLKGKIKIKFNEKIVFQIENKKTGKITIIDKVAILNDQGPYEGYIKLTGANNAEVENYGNTDNNFDDNLDPFDDNWNPMDLNISLNTAYKLKASKNQFYPRPILQFIKDKKEYTVTKRCERIFYKQNNSKKYFVSKLAEEQYDAIRKTYEENKKELADQFTTIINNDLAEEDLVYFRLDSDKKVDAIIPVSISRKASKIPLGKKLDDNFRPCEREWIEDFEMPTELKADSFKKYFLRHPDGYCPACRLFGTTYYRGRVRFGFAHLSYEPIWIDYTKKYMEEAKKVVKLIIPMVPLMKLKMRDNQNSMTLPLLERPRPTWSIPDDNFDIPGRKFYIHHNGWGRIVYESVKGEFAPTKNNRTVEPLGEGNEFRFEVFFENLKPEELGLLLYCLELESGMAHKLGMGKPLGFGSVDIKVENLETYSFEKDKLKINSEKDKNTYVNLGLKSLSKENEWAEIEHIKQLRYLLKIPEISPRVEYPVLNAKDEKINGYSYEQVKDKEEKKDGKVLGAEEIKQNHEKRINKLITPWFSWIDKVKTVNKTTETDSRK